VGSELRASVRDDVLWRRARTSDGGVEQAGDVARTGIFEENLKAEELSGRLVEHDGDVPGERPEGGQREGIPGGPQARRDGHDGGVAMPDMVRPAGDDRLGVYFDRRCALLRKGRVRLSKPRPVQHSSD